jgi:hypothetical protein
VLLYGVPLLALSALGVGLAQRRSRGLS